MTCHAAAVRPGAAALACFVAACTATPGPSTSGERLVSQQVRDAALARAAVWREPQTPIERADLSVNPPGAFRDGDDVTCTFVAENVGGTTPKFYCVIKPDSRGSRQIKVKYGADNPELPAETAASRLLRALGFPVDHLFRVHSVRCVDCPPDPFAAMQCVAGGGTRDRCLAAAKSGQAVVFDSPTIEQPLEGKPIDSAPDQGWSWYELDRITPDAGGASRAQVDALRVIAVLLAHWDNKGPNQRLLCPPGALPRNGGVCAAPLAIVRDLGATFGPLKMDLPNWQHTAMWADARSCVATMKNLPYDGGTFADHPISEEGRQFALGLLKRLNDAQIRGLFEGSGATRMDQVTAAGHDPAAWTRVFFEKVDAIAAAGPCPSAAALAARGR